MGRDGVKVDRQSHSHTMFGVFGKGLVNGGGGVRDLTGGDKLLARDRRHDLPDRVVYVIMIGLTKSRERAEETVIDLKAIVPILSTAKYSKSKRCSIWQAYPEYLQWFQWV